MFAPTCHGIKCYVESLYLILILVMGALLHFSAVLVDWFRMLKDSRLCCQAAYSALFKLPNLQIYSNKADGDTGFIQVHLINYICHYLFDLLYITLNNIT